MDELERLKRRYFLLHGWARFLANESDRRRDEEGMIRYRARGRFGIAVDDDEWALQYQRLNFRTARAHRAIQNDVVREYRFTGNGPLTINLIPGCPVPGWETDPDEVARKRDFERFDEWHRQKAVRAKRKLAEMGVDPREVADYRNALGRAGHEEAMRDACGY